MYKVKEKLFIGFLWIAGAFLLGHAFIPHHHHHSSESVDRCIQARQLHQHDHSCSHEHHHDHQDPFHQHSDNEQNDQCGECHLKGDFFLSLGKIIPSAFCNELKQFQFIPRSIEPTHIGYFIIDHYDLIFYHSYAHRGPPTLTSFQA